MKDRNLTLVDTYRATIAKVTMTKNIMFLLNIKMNVLKCLKTCVKYELGFNI